MSGIFSSFHLGLDFVFFWYFYFLLLLIGLYFKTCWKDHGVLGVEHLRIKVYDFYFSTFPITVSLPLEVVTGL